MRPDSDTCVFLFCTGDQAKSLDEVTYLFPDLWCLGFFLLPEGGCLFRIAIQKSMCFPCASTGGLSGNIRRPSQKTLFAGRSRSARPRGGWSGKGPTQCPRCGSEPCLNLKWLCNLRAPKGISDLDPVLPLRGSRLTLLAPIEKISMQVGVRDGLLVDPSMPSWVGWGAPIYVCLQMYIDRYVRVCVYESVYAHIRMHLYL